MAGSDEVLKGSVSCTDFGRVMLGMAGSKVDGGLGSPTNTGCGHGSQCRMRKRMLAIAAVNTPLGESNGSSRLTAR